MKGLAIIGVVVGHCGVSQWTEGFVNQWHLATFFFVAGMCFKEKYATQPGQYIWRRIKTLYVPFVGFGVLFLALHNVFYWAYCSSNKLSLPEVGKEVFDLTIRLTSSEPLMGAMWFCPALLSSSIIMIFAQVAINKTPCTRRVCSKLLMPITIFTIGYIAIQLHIKSPYCLWQYMVISLIMWMGYWFKCYAKSDKWNVWVNMTVATIGLSSMALATSYDFMARLQPAHVSKESAIALVVVPAFAGISIYSMSVLIKQTALKRILVYVGEHSFSIMALHFLAFKVVNLVQIWVYGYSIQRLAEFPTIEYGGLLIWRLAYVLAGVTLPLALAFVYNKIKQ